MKPKLLIFAGSLLVSQGMLCAQQQQPSRPPIPPTVEAKWDVAYAGTENERQRLDLFLPAGLRAAGTKLPVLVFVHGGAWQAGSKEQGRGQVMKFVTEGKCAGVSVGYRLSQEAQWPAQIHDCKAALRWVKAHAEEYGLDADRIVVWGTSAGGHLVAVLGTSAGVAEMDGKLGPHTDRDTKVAGVIDFFGPTDVSKMNAQRLPGTMDHDTPNAPEAKLLGAPVQTVPDKVKSANPLTYVDKTDPPFLMVHGDKDPLVPHGQSEILQAELKKAGVANELYTVKDGGHGGFKDAEVPRKVEGFLRERWEGKTDARDKGAGKEGTSQKGGPGVGASGGRPDTEVLATSPGGRYECVQKNYADGKKEVVVRERDNGKAAQVVATIDRAAEAMWSPSEEFLVVLNHPTGSSVTAQVLCVRDFTAENPGAKFSVVEIYQSPWPTRADVYWRPGKWDLKKGTVVLHYRYNTDQRATDIWINRSVELPLDYPEP